MAQKKIDSQGEIIDEIRKARAQLGREFKANRKQFFDTSRKLVKELGMHYGTPPKQKKKDAT